MSEIKKRIAKKLSKYPIEVKVLPSVSSIVNGEVSIESIKKVKVEDILGRLPVEPKQSLKKNITGKNVMITGAGGSIGSELCRQILDLSLKKVILFDHSEFNLYSIHHELSKSRKRAQIIPVFVADVTDAKKVSKIIHEECVHTIYHAAAYKHVPMVEMNAVEGVYNNAVGTFNVAVAAHKNGVENLVLISTDKAVRPTNVMGASKRFAELVLQALHKKK